MKKTTFIFLSWISNFYLKGRQTEHSILSKFRWYFVPDLVLERYKYSRCNFVCNGSRHFLECCLHNVQDSEVDVQGLVDSASWMLRIFIDSTAYFDVTLIHESVQWSIRKSFSLIWTILSKYSQSWVSEKFMPKAMVVLFRRSFQFGSFNSGDHLVSFAESRSCILSSVLDSRLHSKCLVETWSSNPEQSLPVLSPDQNQVSNLICYAISNFQTTHTDSNLAVLGREPWGRSLRRAVLRRRRRRFQDANGIPTYQPLALRLRQAVTVTIFKIWIQLLLRGDKNAGTFGWF